MYLDSAPQPGGADRVQERFVRHEIGSCHHDSLSCRIQHRDDEFPTVFAKIAGATRNQLARRLPRVDQVRKQVSWVQHGSSLEIVVRKKHCLELSNNRTGQSHHQLFIRVPPDEFWISDILGSCIPCGAIDHRNLAMISQIETRRVAPKKTYGKHFEYLNPASSQDG